MKTDKYWDLYEERIVETIDSIGKSCAPPLRRISIHLTNKCNLSCKYCNETHSPKDLPEELFHKIISEYSEMGGGVVHVTGGEPTCVSYLENAIDFTKKFKNIQFHLNTNGIKKLKDYSGIRRLKVSLDTFDPIYFDKVVGRKGAFKKVIENLKHINSFKNKPIVSLTYTVTKENYKSIPKFLAFYYENFDFYAVFFSSYKGKNPSFVMKKDDVDDFFQNIVPQMYILTDSHNDLDTKVLFKASHDYETFDEVIRFPENKRIPCYIQRSELVINEDGNIWNCSHLFRDKVKKIGNVKIDDCHILNFNIKNIPLKEIFVNAKKNLSYPLSSMCLYGCNKKLVDFNKRVKQELHRKSRIRNWKKLHTKQLLNTLHSTRVAEWDFDKDIEQQTQDIKDILKTREHIPNKKEAKEIRRSMAKKNRGIGKEKNR